MTPKQVLARITKRRMSCVEDCLGWRVEDYPNARDARVVACAACNALNPASRQIDDAMARSLPDAQHARQHRAAELRRLQRERSTTTHLREDPANMRVLCGHALGKTPGGRRRHGWTYLLADVTCRECERLAALTPEQRAAERAEKFSRFDAKKTEAAAARLAERQERARQIDEMRPTAMVALDLVESEIQLTDDTHAMLDSALRWAVAAHKHEHPRSRGDRLHVLRDIEGGVGNQHCRFCGVRLREGVQIGKDTTLVGASAEVLKHTIRCALKYLAGPLAPQARGADGEPEESP